MKSRLNLRLVGLASLLSAPAAFVASACSDSGASGAGGGAVAYGPCEPTIASIQEDIFKVGCGSSDCHSSKDPAVNLDLVSPGVDARLVGVPSTCEMLLVSAGKPADSFLFQKVAQSSPVCGDRMPRGGVLPDEQVACIQQWITALAGGCETCGGGACVDLQTDPAHCGACETACPSGTSCSAGACVCAGGLALCSGACIATQSDPKNCGGCGVACGATEVCNAGKCSANCDPALTKCGSACIDTTQDAQNCGGCGAACGANEVCTNSKCGCPGGADTNTDPVNCGACGNACAPGQTCEAGTCTCGNASVSFKSAVVPILTNSCATNGCHRGAQAKEGLDLTSANAYGDLVGVKAKQCSDGRLRVKPGDPANSYVIDKLLGADLCFGTQMPKQGQKLAGGDLETIANWICGGAPDN